VQQPFYVAVPPLTADELFFGLYLCHRIASGSVHAIQHRGVFMFDFFIGLAFVVMIVSPAIVATLQLNRSGDI
jgi:hypothetical protein